MALEIGKDPEQDMTHVHDSAKIMQQINIAFNKKDLERCKRAIESYNAKYNGARYGVSRSVLAVHYNARVNTLIPLV
jgi:hypothetical protein